MAVITRHPTGTNDVLRIAGAFVAVFSLVVGMLVLFVIPGSCSFVGGLELLMLSLLFILGVITFLLGAALSWNGRTR